MIAPVATEATAPQPAPGGARSLGTLLVGEVAQAWFARVTGDRNPIHLSDAAARAAGFDGRVVHGVHLVLRILESHIAKTGTQEVPTHLSVRFAKPLFVGEEAALWTRETGAGTELWLEIGRLRLLDLEVGVPVSAASLAAVATFWDDSLAPEWPRKTDLGDVPTDPFGLPASRPLAELAEAFPLLRATLGDARLAAIALQSPLVGMHYPGERSLFLSLKLRLSGDVLGPPRFVIKRADPRLGVVDIKGEGAGIESEARALARSAPPEPVPLSELLRLPLEGRYRGQRAVVIGGTRGLGRLAAAMIALGGGMVWLTYAQSRERAEALAAELRTVGGRVEVFPLTVGAGGKVTHDIPGPLCDVNAIYYFATPHIFERGSGGFDGVRFHRFADCYVLGLCAVFDALRGHLSAGRKSLYFPSTVALERPVAGMTEYVAAKAAAEALAPALEAGDRHLRVLWGRLPRIATEQTVSPVPVTAIDGVDVMVGEVDRVQAQIGGQDH